MKKRFPVKSTPVVKTPVKIFALKKDSERNGHNCSASRCNERSEQQDATGRFWSGESVKLCNRHWGIRCDVSDPLDQERLEQLKAQKGAA